MPKLAQLFIVICLIIALTVTVMKVALSGSAHDIEDNRKAKVERMVG